MSTMVIKCEGKITNPLNNAVITGAIVTSDTFIGSNGDIFGRSTDCSLGGLPINWISSPGFGGQNGYEISDGIALASLNSAATATALNVVLKNYAVQFKVARFDDSITSSGTEFGYFIDGRRNSDGGRRCFRLGFNKSGLTLMYRNKENQFTYYATTPFKVNDTILYIVKDNKHKVYVNGVLKIEAVNDLYLESGYVALSRGSSIDSVGLFGIDDLILYSL